ncbi:hypothetical protein [Streptomyces bacillaris]|uniref:hypothetical protein n=1 Tax=Streptomyces bacillaris TaxID=68179 RepID=UPI003EBA0401
METTTKLGSVGQRVAKEVARLRGRTSVRELSARLTKLGRPILPSGITKMEQGKRRVDVDDLLALAAALQVTPTRLLLGPPPTDGKTENPAHREVWEHVDAWVDEAGHRHPPEQLLRLAPDLALEPWDAWVWAQGDMPLGEIWRLADESSITFPEGEEERFKAENQLPPLRSYFGQAEDVQDAIGGVTRAVMAALDQGLTEGQVEQVVRQATTRWAKEAAVRARANERGDRSDNEGENDA